MRSKIGMLAGELDSHIPFLFFPDPSLLLPPRLNMHEYTYTIQETILSKAGFKTGKQAFVMPRVDSREVRRAMLG